MLVSYSAAGLGGLGRGASAAAVLGGSGKGRSAGWWLETRLRGVTGWHFEVLGGDGMI